jgi:hypothetical protein
MVEHRRFAENLYRTPFATGVMEQPFCNKRRSQQIVFVKFVAMSSDCRLKLRPLD